ncbi:rhomboid family intramembrane serine protease [Lacibacter luteus]|nr:rhomboid family intramembrane serine protease [Lacibacter luteus]
MPHQMITHLFMHGDFGHFFYNMFALWLFGNKLENFWGSKKFLVFYIVSGLGAALIHLGWLSYELYPIVSEVTAYTSSPSLDKFVSFFQKYGVPQAIGLDEVNEFANKWSNDIQNAAFVSDSLVFVKKTGDLIVSRPTVGASGAVFGCLAAFGYLFPNSYIYSNLIFPIKAKWLVLFYTAGELWMVYTNSGGNVAHFAHLGGALIGFLLVLYWNKTNRNTFY